MQKQSLTISIIILVAVITVGFWLMKKEGKSRTEPAETPVVTQSHERARTPEEQAAEDAALARMEKYNAFSKEYYEQNQCCFAMSKPIDKNFLTYNFSDYQNFDDKGNFVPSHGASLSTDQLTQVTAEEYNQVIDTSMDFKSRLVDFGPNAVIDDKCIYLSFNSGQQETYCNLNGPDEYIGYQYLGFSKELDVHVIKTTFFEGENVQLISQKIGMTTGLSPNDLYKFSADKKLLVNYSNKSCDFCGSTGLSVVKISSEGDLNGVGGYLGDGYSGAWGVTEVKIDAENTIYFKTEANSNTYTDVPITVYGGDTGYQRDFDKTHSYFKQVIE